MNEHDSLNSVLREWTAPEPSAALDARIRAAYRAGYRISPWGRFWSARISIPVPALAALLVIVLAVWLQFHSQPPIVPHTAGAPSGEGYITRIDSAGFQPLPDGATRVIRVGGVQR